MRTTLLTGALLLVALLLPSPAAARGCDAFDLRPLEGFDTRYRAYDFATRGVSCRSGRRHIRRYHATANNDTQVECGESGSCSFRGYRCTTKARTTSSVHRCTKGSRVIRWKFRYVSRN